MYTRCDINTHNKATNKTQQIYTNDTTFSIRMSYDAKTKCNKAIRRGDDVCLLPTKSMFSK
jgi:hypothetical protein